MNPLLLTDGYKIDHRRQYPDGTTLVYSNWTPRKSRDPRITDVVFFGLQYFIKKYLQEEFDRDFFGQSKDAVLKTYKRRIEAYLGKDAITYDHIAQLHDLGFLPLEIRAVPEGTMVPMRAPMLTVHNTRPEGFWLTNFLETLMSCVLWLPCTSATTALQYRRLLDGYARRTGSDPAFVGWQAHDFSFRGMGGLEAALLSGAGHLLSFTGTDTIPAIDFLEKYYGADAEKELVGGSVPATEHSVMSMGGMADEIGTFRRLITELYPRGVVSIVSDTWDFWRVMTEYLPQLKDAVLARDGKVVIRPDSGDPVKIVCGDDAAPEGSPERDGAVGLLWKHFGGTITATGHKLLDPHVGVIYGDSINLERAEAICAGLERRGFASTNVVLGIGSFTYQYVTRDTFGFAMKATYGKVDGEGRIIFKDPKTDDGTKRSARGLIQLTEEDGQLRMRDEVSWEEAQHGALQPVFRDGELLREERLADIRTRVAAAARQ